MTAYINEGKDELVTLPFVYKQEVTPNMTFAIGRECSAKLMVRI